MRYGHLALAWTPSPMDKIDFNFSHKTDLNKPMSSTLTNDDIDVLMASWKHAFDKKDADRRDRLAAVCDQRVHRMDAGDWQHGLFR